MSKYSGNFNRNKNYLANSLQFKMTNGSDRFFPFELSRQLYKNIYSFKTWKIHCNTVVMSRAMALYWNGAAIAISTFFPFFTTRLCWISFKRTIYLLATFTDSINKILKIFISHFIWKFYWLKKTNLENDKNLKYIKCVVNSMRIFPFTSFFRICLVCVERQSFYLYWIYFRQLY